MKYIIVATASCPPNEYAILFDEVLTHKIVAGGRPVVSAGFCLFEVREDEFVPVAYGESVSLGLKSRPEKDAAIIAEALGRRI